MFSVGLMCVYSTVYCHSKLERLNLILNPQNSRTWIEYQSSSRVIWVSSQVDQVLSRGDKEFMCQMLKIYQAMFPSVKCSQTQNTFLWFSHEYSFSLCRCSFGYDTMHNTVCVFAIHGYWVAILASVMSLLINYVLIL